MVQGARARIPAILKRTAREPLVIARALAKRYPESPAVSYISAVAWTNTLRLASQSGDRSLRAKVVEQTMPWVSGEKKPFGNQPALTAVAGTMIFAELAMIEDNAGARALAARIADDGALVDVRAGTGAGPTKRYYLDRPAISGVDDRGGAMALLASMEVQALMRPATRRRGENSSAAPTVR